MSRPIPREDVAFILEKLNHVVGNEMVRNERILLTGATGFFGKWLTQTLLALEESRNLGNCLVLVTRDRKRALVESPWLNENKNIEWIEGDIRNLRDHGSFDSIIHGAAAASQSLNVNQPTEMFDTILDGTRRVLDIAKTGCKRFLFISSGAVYGPQPFALETVPETYLGGPSPLDPKSAYGEAKRAAEFLCASVSRVAGFHLSVARCYAFAGPYLPLDTHFAAGNFLRNVLAGEPISIGGDGTPHRSYMYPADLMIWLLALLFRGKNQTAYNVGSDQGVSIAELAEAVHKAGLKLKPDRHQLASPIQIAKRAMTGQAFERYVPSIDLAKQDLGLKIWTNLDEGLLKTLRWHLD